MIWYDTKLGPISLEQNVENSVFDFCAGVWVGWQKSGQIQKFWQIWIRSLIFLIKIPSRIFSKSFISSKRVKSILISCLRPYRTRPSRRAPGRVASSLNYQFVKFQIFDETHASNWRRTLMTESVMGLISWMTSQPSWMTITTAAWHLMHSLVQLVLPKNGTHASALHSSGTLLLTNWPLWAKNLKTYFEKIYDHVNFQSNFSLMRWLIPSFDFKCGFSLKFRVDW